MSNVFETLINGIYVSTALLLGTIASFIFKSTLEDEEEIAGKIEFIIGILFLLLTFFSIEGNRFSHFSFVICCSASIIAYMQMKNLIEYTANKIFSFSSIVDQRMGMSLILLFVKFIIVALSVGMILNITNTGLSNTLLVSFSFYFFFQGTFAALCFSRLVQDNFLTFIGALFLSCFILGASLLGSAWGYTGATTYILLFNSLFLMSEKMIKLFLGFIPKNLKLYPNHGFVSGVVVLLIIFLIKENV